MLNPFTKGKSYFCYAEKSLISYKNILMPDCSRDEPIRLSWGAGFSNFGDELGVIIVKVLSGRQIVGRNFDGTLKSPKLLALGTILHRARDHDIVWGTGVRKDRSWMATHLDVRAVRGPLTYQYLSEKNIECPMVYGDPAILTPFFFKPPITKKYSLGIIAHHHDRSCLRDIRWPKTILINPADDPLEVIKKICQCEVVLSSALHGIILAEAYDVPACWMRAKPQQWRQDYTPLKYNDYYLSTQRDPLCYEYSDHIDIDRTITMAINNKKPVIDREKLLKSFPYLRPEIKSLEDLRGYEIKEVKIKMPWNIF